MGFASHSKAAAEVQIKPVHLALQMITFVGVLNSVILKKIQQKWQYHKKNHQKTTILKN